MVSWEKERNDGPKIACRTSHPARYSGCGCLGLLLCVCVFVCLCRCVHMHIHMYGHVCMCVVCMSMCVLYVRASVYVCVFMCMGICVMFTYMCGVLYACACVFVHMHMCVHIFVCVFQMLKTIPMQPPGTQASTPYLGSLTVHLGFYLLEVVVVWSQGRSGCGRGGEGRGLVPS